MSHSSVCPPSRQVPSVIFKQSQTDLRVLTCFFFRANPILLSRVCQHAEVQLVASPVWPYMVNPVCEKKRQKVQGNRYGPQITKFSFSQSASHRKTSRVPAARWQESGDTGPVSSHPEYPSWYQLHFQKESKGAAAYCRQLPGLYPQSSQEPWLRLLLRKAGTHP